MSARDRLDEPPRGARIQLSREQLRLGGLVAAGAVAALAFPRLLATARRSVRTIGGMTYSTGRPGAPPEVDPARRRAA